MRFKDIALPLAARGIKVIPVQPGEGHEGNCAETDAREKEAL